ncbi:MAG: hypothetical protein F6K54_14685 [Okeania sp. SIO3B5]|uniref:hypothetical protein n=1 Tax=Okeania sp. SIO3B5 TaxID=2607811 RepID=UPI001401321D|nr:hypothetical protein [Okeania sp. SIO3B5]NEO54217.1 hypothetical protein [Okeania sp. SIO3B5]
MKITQVIVINHNLDVSLQVNKLFGDRWQKLSFEQEVKIQDSGEKLGWSLINKSGKFSLSLSSFIFLLPTSYSLLLTDKLTDENSSSNLD